MNLILAAMKEVVWLALFLVAIGYLITLFKMILEEWKD